MTLNGEFNNKSSIKRILIFEVFLTQFQDKLSNKTASCDQHQPFGCHPAKPGGVHAFKALKLFF